MTTNTTPIRLADVCDECFGVLKLHLESCEQCVLSFDSERLGTRRKSQPERVVVMAVSLY
ncbi:hypothetical protein AC628_02605 [Bradyrhizobium sp. NAS96.2]|nr:hypothetical protein AC628_02605 [Bradyrhizobium sp. NAS96.2]